MDGGRMANHGDCGRADAQRVITDFTLRTDCGGRVRIVVHARYQVNNGGRGKGKNAMTHQHQTRWRRSRLAAVAGSLALAGLALAPAFAQPASAARVGRRATAPASVTIWDIQTGDEQKNLDAFAASFNRAHPTIRVQYQWYQNDPYKTKLAIAVGAHRGPDIFMGWGGGILQSYVKSGAVADLTSAFKAAPSWRSRYLPVVMKPVTFGGHIYGVPYENTQPEVIIYNKAIFARYHLSVPKTWPQLQQIIKTLQSHNVIPFALAGKSEWPE